MYRCRSPPILFCRAHSDARGHLPDQEVIYAEKKSVYGVSGGKSAWGRAESKEARILPVALEMTKVAAETRPDLTAREDATIVIAGASAASVSPLGGDRGGVG